MIPLYLIGVDVRERTLLGVGAWRHLASFLARRGAFLTVGILQHKPGRHRKQEGDEELGIKAAGQGRDDRHGDAHRIEKAAIGLFEELLQNDRDDASPEQNNKKEQTEDGENRHKLI